MTETDAAAARAILDAFWNSYGETSAEEGAQVLLAAYALGDKKEFTTVLYEVISPVNDDVTWEMLTAFKQSDVVPPST
jgi:hypothetical protein